MSRAVGFLSSSALMSLAWRRKGFWRLAMQSGKRALASVDGGDGFGGPYQEKGATDGPGAFQRPLTVRVKPLEPSEHFHQLLVCP